MAGFVIKEVWAYVAIDPDDGDEGVIGATLTPGMFMPFVAADKTRVAELRPYAMAIGREKNVTIKLIKLSTREDLEVIYASTREDVSHRS